MSALVWLLALVLSFLTMLLMGVSCLVAGFDFNGWTVLVALVFSIAAARFFWMNTVEA